MNFPNYGYKDYHNDNKEAWPIQPPTSDAWSKMLKAQREYCSKLVDVFEFLGQCDSKDLPSCHPYWRLVVFKRTLRLIDRTAESIKETKQYIDSGGYHEHNARVSLHQQQESLRYYISTLHV